MADNLNIYEDFEIDILVERRNSSTRAIEPATGVTGWVAWFSLTETGAAIGSTSTALTEAGTTGRMVGVIDTATLVTDLAAYVNRKVYLVASKSGDVGNNAGEYIVRTSRTM